MNAKPTFPRSSSFSIAIAAAMATFVAIGLLTAVAFMFQRDGAPLEQVVIAEHACANYAFVSDREACVRLYLATSRGRNVASR